MKPLTAELVDYVIDGLRTLDNIPRSHPTRTDWTALDKVWAVHIEVWAEKLREA